MQCLWRFEQSWEIKAVACHKLCFREFSWFVSPPDDKGAMQVCKNYISECLIISFHVHSVKGCMFLSSQGWDSRKSALQNILSQASDMHIDPCVGGATFKTSFVLMKEIWELQMQWLLWWQISILTVQTQSLRLSFNLLYSALHSSNYNKNVRWWPFLKESLHTLHCNKDNLITHRKQKRKITERIAATSNECKVETFVIKSFSISAVLVEMLNAGCLLC